MEDYQLIIFSGISASSLSATSLVFESVGRGHIGSYMCIASNGVPPSVSKRVDLKVQCKARLMLSVEQPPLTRTLPQFPR